MTEKFKIFLSTAVFVILFMTNTAALTVDEIKNSLIEADKYLETQVQNISVSSVGGEWTVIARMRNPYLKNNLSKEYTDALKMKIDNTNGVLSNNKLTEYARSAIALKCLGLAPQDIYDLNFYNVLCDTERIKKQGTNAVAYALIALHDTGNLYKNAIDEYISIILSRQNEDGGFSVLDMTSSDIDVTAMCLQALSLYNNDNIKNAVNNGLMFLSKTQREDGGYTYGNIKNSETSAQVLTAISALGISYTDERFTKNGNTLLSNILSFQNADGGFKHVISSDKSNLMATEQCTYALVSAARLIKSMTSLYDFSDVIKHGLPNKNKDIKNITKNKHSVSFTDVAISDNAYNEIMLLSEHNIINGYQDGSFKPDKTITRAEICKILVTALSLSNNSQTSFYDVKEDDWFSNSVKTASAYGLVKGKGNGVFNPDSQITLQEIYLIIERTAYLCGYKNESSYTSTNKYIFDDWAKSGVEFAVKNKICENNSKNLTMYATRREVSKIIYDVLKMVNLM